MIGFIGAIVIRHGVRETEHTFIDEIEARDYAIQQSRLARNRGKIYTVGYYHANKVFFVYYRNGEAVFSYENGQ